MRTLLGVMLVLVLAAGAARAQEFKAADAGAIKAALGAAGPGDTIVVKPGEYNLGGGASTGRDGTKDQPECHVERRPRGARRRGRKGPIEHADRVRREACLGGEQRCEGRPERHQLT